VHKAVAIATVIRVFTAVRYEAEGEGK